MKTVLFVLTPFYVSAQLRVLSNGNVNIKSVYNYVPAALSVGVNDSSSISTLDIGYLGLYVKSPINSPIPSLNRDFPDPPPFRISMMGSANDVAGSAGYFSCGTIGVMGRAGNNYPGYNYGVFGTLIGSNNGAGVYASTGEQNCRICMSSYNDYGNSDYMVSYIDNSHIYGIGDSTYYVCITKPEYIPYCAIVGNDVYVQNETYNSDFRISGRSIIAGQNVTPNKPEGSVVLQNGKTKMHAIDDVTLMGGFVVELGAELEISVEN